MNNNINPSDFSILIVDDNATNTILLDAILKREKYKTLIARNGETALQIMQEKHPDLVLLDIMMPEMDGLTACSRIREFSNIPIIFLTAKSDDMDKLIGFDHGTDDYLTKPFNILELKARIRALLRRSGAGDQGKIGNILTVGTITLDLDARNAYKGDELADLTAKEFDVIEFLMRNPNQLCPIR